MIKNLSPSPALAWVRDSRSPETTPVSGAGMRNAFGDVQATLGPAWTWHGRDG
ncbi:hypothetical protein [Kitasatospora sp. NPDC096204]|uniref:hypothetical protein n=1 Tax=Kitasatospora sp. NPDC096204 TaxID=3364094 RepID=UPI0038052CCA